MHAEVVGDLVEGEQALGVQSLRVAGQPVFLSNVDDYCCGEGLSAA